jgi:methionyl aminopeptidase
MQSLCGHGVGRWAVHCPPPIPNVADGSRGTLAKGAVVAIEPFATPGAGLVAERGRAEVFRLPPDQPEVAGLDPVVMEALRAFRGLPFCRRQLVGLPRETVEACLASLRARGRLQAYAPLVEAGGRPVAQAEHTVLVGEEGALVLTR